MGSVLKSLDGIPDPAFPIPKDVVMADEARTARRRFYPVTILYTAFCVPLASVAVLYHPRPALLSLAAGVAFWTLLEYLVHRHVLHGRFPDGAGLLKHRMHTFFDTMHGDHHLRPWDGMYINGYLDSIPFAILFVLMSSPWPYYTGTTFVAALLQSYVVEEWVHYSVHFCHFKPRYFRYIRHHHWYHHSLRGKELAFGLTSGLWDAALGTRIPAPLRFGARFSTATRRARPRVASRPPGGVPPVLDGGPERASGPEPQV
jgi:sterol desaturase/sphingolipid hydroxylase (fatty acid hydroxylase superfamily)